MGCLYFIILFLIAQDVGGGIGVAIFIGGTILYNIINRPRIRVINSPFRRRTYNSDEFIETLLILSAAVIKADGRFVKSELNYIKNFFLRNMGEAQAYSALLRLREIMDSNYNIHSVCSELNQNSTIYERLLVLQFLFGIASADGALEEVEIAKIREISDACGIPAHDFESIKAMYQGGYQQYGGSYGGNQSSQNYAPYSMHSLEEDYKILEVSPEASDEEVKKSYRTLAKKYHPDRVAHLGEDMQRAAEEKFSKLGEAYNNIKKARGIN